MSNSKKDKIWRIPIRDLLAMLISIISIVGIGVVSWLVLGSLKGTAGFEDKVMTVFTTIAALTGSWVGTILAFYFSRQNFESATENAAALVKQMTPLDRLKRIPAKDKMTKRAEMFVVKTPNEEINLSETLKKLDESKKGSRLPLLDENDHPVCILHRSTIVEYMYKQKAELGPETLTMKDLMDDWKKDAKLTEWLKNSFTLIGENATLGDAKAAMDAKKNCQDVFVTKTGSQNEPVLGWISNVTISENAVSWE